MPLARDLRGRPLVARRRTAHDVPPCTGAGGRRSPCCARSSRPPLRTRDSARGPPPGASRVEPVDHSPRERSPWRPSRRGGFVGRAAPSLTVIAVPPVADRSDHVPRCRAVRLRSSAIVRIAGLEQNARRGDRPSRSCSRRRGSIGAPSAARRTRPTSSASGHAGADPGRESASITAADSGFSGGSVVRAPGALDGPRHAPGAMRGTLHGRHGRSRSVLEVAAVREDHRDAGARRRPRRPRGRASSRPAG